MAYIGLDIGHGTDTWEKGGGKGVVKNGRVYEEHDFNSKIAIATKALLEAQGHKVTYGIQQPNSKDMPLSARTNKFNAISVDFVISMHANAGEESVDGRCVFYWHDHSTSKKLAENIVKAIHEKGYSTHGNGLHASMTGSWTNLHMVRETKMTAILVEYGFMTNAKDFEYIFGSKQNQYIKDMAEATVKGVQAYLGRSFAFGGTTNKPSTSGMTSIDKLAQEIIDGKHGSGDARKKSLGANYNKVQARVNEILLGTSAKTTKSVTQLAQEVLDGKHGSGDARKRSLGSQYDEVQAEVNRILGVGVKSVDTVAREVIDGKWGNGSDRRNRLTAAGYNYNSVQARVNQLL